MKSKRSEFEKYDFSDCHEIIGDDLYLINGGAQIENSNEAVAGAQVGDTLTQNDGTQVTITQGDITWAQQQLNGGDNSSSQTTPAATDPTPAPEPSKPASSSSSTSSSSSSSTSSSSTPSASSNSSTTTINSNTAFNNSQTTANNPTDTSNNLHKTSGNSALTSNNPAATSSNSSLPPADSTVSNTSANPGNNLFDFSDPFAPESNGNFEIDNDNKTVSANINNAQSVIDAYGAYYILSDRDYAFQLKDGNDVVHTFTDENAVKNYVKTLDTSNGNFSLSDTLGNISTVTGVANKALDYSGDYINDISKATKIASISKNLSKISFVSGTVTTGIDIVKAVQNPSFDTISDVIIDGIGLIPGGVVWSIGLSGAKYGAKKMGEEIEKLYQDYTDYKINELCSPLLPENEKNQNMFEPNNMFWKMAETGVKQLLIKRY